MAQHMSSITSDGKPGASPKIIRWIALGLLVAYIAIFIALSAMILSVFASMVAQGGGFVPGFETIQLKRLIAFLAPYLSLPVLFVVALIFYRKMKYRVSIIVSLILLLTIFGTAQTYLHYNPDPI
jgi:hypothetical protein